MSTLTITSSFPPVPARAAVRLTRRGRLVLLALFLVLAAVALTVVGGSSAATRDAGAPVPTQTVVVTPGDTLWAIAADVADPGEVRSMVHRIAKLNALAGSSLQLGQEIAVPLD